MARSTVRGVRAAAASAAVLGVVGGVANVASADPNTIVAACSPVRVGSRAISVDVIAGKDSCATARQLMLRYIASSPRAGKSRSVTAGHVTLSCSAYGRTGQFPAAWRYVCRNKTYSVAFGAERYFPASGYTTY
jgi:hypothetical protein